MRTYIKSLYARMNKPSTRRAYIAVAILAGGLLAGRVSLLKDMHIASEAYIAATAFFQGPLAFAALGALIGRISLGINRAIPIEVLPMVLTFSAVLILKLTKQRPSKWIMVLICVASRLPLFIFSSFLVYDVLMFLLSQGLCVATVLSFITAYEAIRDGEAKEGLIIIVLSIALLLSALPYQAFMGISLYMLAASVLIMFAGAALGLTLVLANNGEMHIMGILAAAGVLAGALRELKRFAVMAGYFCASCLLGVLYGANPFAVISWQTLLLACVIIAAVPNRVYHLADRKMTGGAMRVNRWRTMDLLSKKVKAFAACLRSLHSVFEDVTHYSDGEGWQEMTPVLELVCEQCCEGCPEKHKCWEENIYDTYRVLCMALSKAEENKAVYKSDVDKGFMDNCLSPKQLTQSLNSAYIAYRMRKSMSKKIDESRELVKLHLSGTAVILDEMAGGIKKDTINDSFAVMQGALDGCGADIYNMELTAEGCRISCAPCGSMKRCEKMARRISSAMDKPYTLQSFRCGGVRSPCSIQIAPAHPLRINYGAAQTPLAGTFCGDAFITKRLDSGTCILALADGMGSGARAAVEAKSTLDLLMSFFNAGFDEDAVFSIINRALLLRSGSEMFAAVDACFIDPLAREYRFLKVGAAPSYIIRGGEVITIYTPSIPLGIVDEATPVCIKRTALPGDAIVLCSDGFNAKLYMDDMLRLAGAPPTRVARSLATQGKAKDDVTVLAARIKAPLAQDKAELRLDRWKSRVAIG